MQNSFILFLLRRAVKLYTLIPKYLEVIFFVFGWYYFFKYYLKTQICGVSIFVVIFIVLYNVIIYLCIINCNKNLSLNEAFIWIANAKIWKSPRKIELSNYWELIVFTLHDSWLSSLRFPFCESWRSTDRAETNGQSFIMVIPLCGLCCSHLSKGLHFYIYVT